MKDKFLTRLKKVDVTEQDWADDLLATLPRCYERGYLEAMVSEWNAESREFNEELVDQIGEWCDWIKWLEDV